MSSGFIRVFTVVRTSFLSEAEQYSIVRTDHILSIPLSTDTWVTSVNADAMNMGAKVTHLEEVEIEEQSQARGRSMKACSTPWRRELEDTGRELTHSPTPSLIAVQVPAGSADTETFPYICKLWFLLQTDRCILSSGSAF